MISKVITVILLIGLADLQYHLWFGEGGYHTLEQMEKLLIQQQQENSQLKERNAILKVEVTDLKQGLEAIEERARTELGMIKHGEVFYEIIE